MMHIICANCEGTNINQTENIPDPFGYKNKRWFARRYICNDCHSKFLYLKRFESGPYNTPIKFTTKLVGKNSILTHERFRIFNGERWLKVTEMGKERRDIYESVS